MADTAKQAFVRQAFWLVLARAPADVELREQERNYTPGDERTLILQFLSSPEFRLVFEGWKTGRGIDKDPVVHDVGLRTLGADEPFVKAAYTYLLDRDADAGGLAHYLEALRGGWSRVDLVRTLVLSEEFARRYEDFAPDAGFVPRDVQLCELANPAKWDNPDWMALLRSLGTVADHKLAMHRKSYEFTQLLFGLTRLGCLSEHATVLSVGAGHEAVLYWLANRVGRVVATDMYEGRWQSQSGTEGDARVLRRPEEYAPFAYRRDRLAFLKMDGRRLAFRDGAFDVVYSLSSIEHFGGAPGAVRAIDEMSRVLKPGGVLVVATEFIISGPAYHEAFLPREVHALFSRPDLQLVEPIDEQVYRRNEYRAVDLNRNRHQTPHMVVRDGDAVITSVIAFLKKI